MNRRLTWVLEPMLASDMFLLSLQSNSRIPKGDQVTLVHFCIKAGRNSFGGVKGQSQGIKASASFNQNDVEQSPSPTSFRWADRAQGGWDNLGDGD